MRLFKKDKNNLFSPDRYDDDYERQADSPTGNTYWDITGQQYFSIHQSLHHDVPGSVQADGDRSVHPSCSAVHDYDHDNFNSSDETCEENSGIDDLSNQKSQELAPEPLLYEAQLQPPCSSACSKDELFNELQSVYRDQYYVEDGGTADDVFNNLKTTVEKRRCDESSIHVDSYGCSENDPYYYCQASHDENSVEDDMGAKKKRREPMDPWSHAQLNPENISVNANDPYYCNGINHDDYGVEDCGEDVFNVLRTTVKKKRSDAFSLDYGEPAAFVEQNPAVSSAYVEPNPGNLYIENHPYNCEVSDEPYGAEDDENVFNVLKTTVKKKRSMEHEW